MSDKSSIAVDGREPDPLLHEALDWIVRLKTGEPTRDDVDALQRWRAQSPAHEAAFKTAVRVFRHAGVAAHEVADRPVAPGIVPAAPAIGLVAAAASSSRIFARRAFLGGAIAAATAGYLVVNPPLGLWPSLEELSADYRTGKGEHRRITVATDVSLELNTQTSIALRQAQDQTRIELISGEAAVGASSSAKPFIMLAADGSITATQADFNARCIDGVVSVTCLDGAVDVVQGDKSVRLSKAQQVSYSAAGIEPAVPIDPVQVAAWQSGLLIFRDRSLADVVEEVNRYRSGKIIITRSDLKSRIVNGTFQISKLDDFVGQVQQLFGAQVRSLLGGVVLLG
jgi:transmembrane sensor